MITYRFWVLQLALGIALNLSPVSCGVHYHRYFLSDYMRQHRHKTQQDYLPLPRPTYAKTEQEMNTTEPMVSMLGGQIRTRLHDILVRIYHDNNYICMGTLLTQQVVLTAATCFRNKEVSGLSVKTSDNKMRPLYDRLDDALEIDKEGTIKLLALKQPIKQRQDKIAKLCTYPLNPEMGVELPTYIRSARKVRNQVTRVMRLTDCQNMLGDKNSNMLKDSMFCVRNKKISKTCQETFGAPILHDGEICGVNLLGHNCPQAIGFDTYATVMSKADFIKEKVKSIKLLKIEDAIH